MKKTHTNMNKKKNRRHYKMVSYKGFFYLFYLFFFLSFFMVFFYKSILKTLTHGYLHRLHMLFFFLLLFYFLWYEDCLAWVWIITATHDCCWLIDYELLRITVEDDCFLDVLESRLGSSLIHSLFSILPHLVQALRYIHEMRVITIWFLFLILIWLIATCNDC